MNASIATFTAGQTYAAQNEPSADYQLLSELRQAALDDYTLGFSKEWNRGLSEGYKARMVKLASRSADIHSAQVAVDLANDNRRFANGPQEVAACDAAISAAERNLRAPFIRQAIAALA